MGWSHAPNLAYAEGTECAREVANGFARTWLRGLLGAEGEVANVSGQGTDRRGLKGYSTGRRTLGGQAV